MWHLRLVSYQNKYILLVISNFKTFPKRLGLFCKIQKHKAFPIILCSRILWSRYFFLIMWFHFLHLLGFQDFKKSIFYFWQMYYTLGCLDKKYLGLKISTWTCCHEWIWFSSKHWKTNLKVIMEAPRNTVFDLLCSFLMAFLSLWESPWKKGTSMV